MWWRSRSRTRRIEDDSRTSPDVKLSGRQLTAQQKDERRQDNGDKKQLARQHPSYLLRSLTRERDRRRTTWRHLNSASSFAIRSIELSTCSTWGTWCACVYLVGLLMQYYLLWHWLAGSLIPRPSCRVEGGSGDETGLLVIKQSISCQASHVATTDGCVTKSFLKENKRM